MYEDFYGLTGSPFRLTPDQRFWFGSEGHRKAMSYLKYGLYQGEGFIVVTGGVGTGKSTIVAQLFAELDEDEIVAAQIGTTQIEAEDAIRMICDSYAVDSPSGDKAALIGSFENFLIEQNQNGRRVLLVVDEAQNLPIRTLEELRMLSNLNLQGQPLFQIFLVAQPQFVRTLQHPDMAQLQQRVIASYKLEAMSAEETQEYVTHRLELVGWQNDPEFDQAAFDRIYTETKGVPRRINTLCNRILLYTSLEEMHRVTEEAVAAVIEDLRREATGGAAPAPRPKAKAPAAKSAAPAARSAAPAVRKQAPAPQERTAMADQQTLAAIAAIAKRLDTVEDTLADHDKAIREIIDIVVNVVSMDEDQANEAAHARAGGR